jgi:2,4-dienoyl-CoA reductase-like NADH-dependent reductase (Old Yellow Enzyme family)
MSRSSLFLKQIEAFLARSGMTATGFGKAVVKDPNFVHDLRSGRRPNLDLCDRCLEFIAEYDRKALFENGAS